MRPSAALFDLLAASRPRLAVELTLAVPSGRGRTPASKLGMTVVVLLFAGAAVVSYLMLFFANENKSTKTQRVRDTREPNRQLAMATRG